MRYYPNVSGLTTIIMKKPFELPVNPYQNKVEKKVTKTPNLKDNFSAYDTPTSAPVFQKIKDAFKPAKVKKEIKF